MSNVWTVHCTASVHMAILRANLPLYVLFCSRVKMYKQVDLIVPPSSQWAQWRHHPWCWQSPPWCSLPSGPGSSSSSCRRTASSAPLSASSCSVPGTGSLGRREISQSSWRISARQLATKRLETWWGEKRPLTAGNKYNHTSVLLLLELNGIGITSALTISVSIH